jgi:hypothetical protein
LTLLVLSLVSNVLFSAVILRYRKDNKILKINYYLDKAIFSTAINGMQIGNSLKSIRSRVSNSKL